PGARRAGRALALCAVLCGVFESGCGATLQGSAWLSSTRTPGGLARAALQQARWRGRGPSSFSRCWPRVCGAVRRCARPRGPPVSSDSSAPGAASTRASASAASAVAASTSTPTRRSAPAPSRADATSAGSRPVLTAGRAVRRPWTPDTSVAARGQGSTVLDANTSVQARGQLQGQGRGRFHYHASLSEMNIPHHAELLCWRPVRKRHTAGRTRWTR
ncbi:Dynactin subunit 1, partial [Frankliniella fusca]